MPPSIHQGRWALAASIIGRDSSSFNPVISINSSTGDGRKPAASSFSTPIKVLGGGYRGGGPLPQCSSSAALARGSPDSVTMVPHHNGGRLFSPASNNGHDGPLSSSSSSCRGGSNGGCHPHFGGSANFVYGSLAAPSKKYKTEMCNNILVYGYCKFGEHCHYAHSEQEQKPPCAKELRKDDHLLFPCSIMVSTGFW